MKHQDLRSSDCRQTTKKKGDSDKERGEVYESFRSNTPLSPRFDRVWRNPLSSCFDFAPSPFSLCVFVVSDSQLAAPFALLMLLPLFA